MASQPVIQPWILGIDPYVPGAQRAQGFAEPIKLSSNENPHGPSPAARAVIADHAQGVHRYPDGGATRLRERLGRVHGLDPARIVVGTGSDELLQLLPLLLCDRGDTVVHVRHGFMVYPIAARRAGAVPLAAPDRDYTADVDAILDAVRDDTRIVYLANPNNPTGTSISRDEVARLHRGLRPDVLLVLDQAYAEYADHPDPDGALALARKAENVVTTRTFSKIYGLGGLRVGWATGPAAIVDALNRARAPFPVTTLGLVAAETALADQEWVARCREANARERKALMEAIDAKAHRGLCPIPSAANFVLVTMAEHEGPASAAALHAGLAARGILVRWLPGQGLPHALRISVGTEAEVARVVAALDELLDG